MRKEVIEATRELNKFTFDLSSLRLGPLETEFRCQGKIAGLELTPPGVEVIFPPEPYDHYLGIASVDLSSPLEVPGQPFQRVLVVRIHVREETVYPAFVPTFSVSPEGKRWQMDLSQHSHHDLLEVSVVPGHLITKGEDRGKYRMGALRWGGILQARQVHNPCLRKELGKKVEGILNREIPPRSGTKIEVGFELISFLGGIMIGAAVKDSATPSERHLDQSSLKIALPGARVKLTAQGKYFLLEVPPRANYLDGENDWDFLVGYPEPLPPFARENNSI